MAKILANDGITAEGKQLLEDAGHLVQTEKIAQDDLLTRLNEFDAILVRSATQVRRELIDACPNLRFIGRGGVGMDNIDVDYARSKGICVANTPLASSRSVAELVIAHVFSGFRFLHRANREMPLEGRSNFSGLKKDYSKGRELGGKTLGIIGLGGIGQEVARLGLGLGMKVVGHRRTPGDLKLSVSVNGTEVDAVIPVLSLDDLLGQSDVVTLHVPFQKGAAPILGYDELAKMKDGAGLVNTARGGAVDEEALLDALNHGRLSFAGVDVFVNEPEPRPAVLAHPGISLTPHTGGSTNEAQARVWVEMADQLIEHFS